MKLRILGLVVLAAAHVSAPALPSVCAKNYRRAWREAESVVDRLALRRKSVLAAGVGGGLAGSGLCLLKTRSVAGLFICPAIFMGVGVISWQYSEDLQNQINAALDASAIFEVYREFKDHRRKSEIEIQALTYVGLDSLRDSEVKAEWIKAVDNGDFCDSKGRPNKSLLEAAEILKSRFN